MALHSADVQWCKTYCESNPGVSMGSTLQALIAWILNKISVINILFMIIFICPITSLEIGDFVWTFSQFLNQSSNFDVNTVKLKLKFCTSNPFRLFHFKSVVVACRASIMKIVSLSKYFHTLGLKTHLWCIFKNILLLFTSWIISL